MAEWYYTNNRQQLGPVTTQELKVLADAGNLKPSDLVWREGMPNWVKAETAKGLFSATATQAAPQTVKAKPVEEPEYAEPIEDDLDEKPRRRRAGRDDDDDDDRSRRRRVEDADDEVDDDRPRRRNRRDDYDDDEDDIDDRPRRRRRVKQNSGAALKIVLGIGAVALVLVLAIVGIVLLVNSSSGTGPRTFSLAQGRNTWWHVSFKPQHRVDIRVVSNGQSDVDLFVYDAKGNRIAADEDLSKDCFVSFVALDNQRYKVEVQNRVHIDPGHQQRNGPNSGTVTFTETPLNLAQNKPPVFNPPINNPVINPPVVPPPNINPPINPKFRPKGNAGNLVAIAIAEGGTPLTASLTPADARVAGRQAKLYTYPMVQGKMYTITMNSKQIDSYLRIEDPNGVLVGQDDDGGDGLNARLTIRANVTGQYRIIATTFGGGIGEFVLQIQAN